MHAFLLPFYCIIMLSLFPIIMSLIFSGGGQLLHNYVFHVNVAIMQPCTERLNPDNGGEEIQKIVSELADLNENVLPFVQDLVTHCKDELYLSLHLEKPEFCRLKDLKDKLIQWLAEHNWDRTTLAEYLRQFKLNQLAERYVHL